MKGDQPSQRISICWLKILILILDDSLNCEHTNKEHQTATNQSLVFINHDWYAKFTMRLGWEKDNDEKEVEIFI